MTDQELRDLIAENSKAIKEMKESQEKDSKKLKESIEKTMENREKDSKELTDSIKELRESIKELRESQKQTDKQLRETDERIDKRLSKLEKLYGDFGNNRGEEVEDFFYRYFSKHKELLGIKFDDVERNVITAEGQEHDIILVNGKVS